MCIHCWVSIGAMECDDDAGYGIQKLILLHGRERASELVPARHRSLVEIAAEVLADDTRNIGITYAGFCLTSLPHKRLPDGETWRKAGHKVSLLVEPGTMLVKGREIRYGVPYGARARVILLFLQTQAVKTRSREIQLGRSMYEWMERMCVPVGGETARALKEQAARISACSLKFFWENGADEGWAAGRIVASGLRFNAKASAQGRLWDDCVMLDEAFYKALEDHSVPLQEAAIRELHDRSMSLDLYVWLAWRLHVLSKAVSVSWPAIYGQFGAGYSKISHFKPRFTEALAAAVAAYPQCKVTVDAESGLTLHPSPPPVSRLLAAS
jgi:Plasmid encoded RepA protein